MALFDESERRSTPACSITPTPGWPPRVIRARLGRAAIPALLILLAGCVTPDREAPRTTPATAVAAGPNSASWPFWPARMRLHPLTRFVSDETIDESHIAARLEFFDADGHTTKGWGRAMFQLAGPDRSLLAEWELDLTVPEINRERFDDVTRTYLVPLHLDTVDTLPDEPLLRARFLSADGREFREELRVRVR